MNVRTFQRDMPLTDREFEILMLVTHGQSAKKTAISGGIAPRTVESHFDSIRMKLGTRNRTHMVMISIASHILPLPLIEIQIDQAIGALRSTEPYASQLAS